jgi:hypothetical protein
MEDILDLYVAPHPEEEPLIAMDEASKQLLTDAREPLPLAPGQPARQDYHYERHGVQALFMFFDPLRGWRRVSCRDSRTRVDWAEEVRRLLDEDYPHARKVKLVCDNLNTHHLASLYEAFPAAEARRLARRLEIHSAAGQRGSVGRRSGGVAAGAQRRPQRRGLAVHHRGCARETATPVPPADQIRVEGPVGSAVRTNRSGNHRASDGPYRGPYKS